MLLLMWRRACPICRTIVLDNDDVVRSLAAARIRLVVHHFTSSSSFISLLLHTSRCSLAENHYGHFGLNHKYIYGHISPWQIAEPSDRGVGVLRPVDSGVRVMRVLLGGSCAVWAESGRRYTSRDRIYTDDLMGPVMCAS